jgi:hypothetical protein
VPNLSTVYRCVQDCAGRGAAFVTQNGWDLNLTNEIGQQSRAWNSSEQMSGELGAFAGYEIRMIRQSTTIALHMLI